MKFNFKKISALGASILLTGMTLGFAAAAAAPAPFAQNGVVDYAVVYGASAPDGLDLAQATSVAEYLSGLGSGGITVTGGDSFKLEKPSSKFYFGDQLSKDFTSLGYQELNTLKEGEYKDGRVDVKYTQKITLSDPNLEMFSKKEDKDKTLIMGFQWANKKNILNYLVEFKEEVNYSEMKYTHMPLLGNEYYVLDVNKDEIILLKNDDSAQLSSGETVTVGGKSVELVFVQKDKADFKIDGVTIKDTIYLDKPHKLDDGSYLILNKVMFHEYQGGTQEVDFSIASGEIKLTNSEVKLEGKKVEDLQAVINGSLTHLQGLELKWNSYKETYLTEDESIEMPLFESIQLVFGGLDTPSDPEKISLNGGEQLILEMGNYELPVMWINETSTYLGEEGYPLIWEETEYTYKDLGYLNGTFVWWEDFYLNHTNQPKNVTTNSNPNQEDKIDGEYLNLSEKDRFIVTRTLKDLTDLETLYYEVKEITYKNSEDWKVELENLIDKDQNIIFENEKNLSKVSKDTGKVIVSLGGFHNESDFVLVGFSATGGGILGFNQAISEKGLVVTIPTANLENAEFVFNESYKDGKIVSDAKSFKVNVTNHSSDILRVSSVKGDVIKLQEDESKSKREVGYIKSSSASKITHDKNNDEYEFTVEYFGKEVTADVRVVMGGEVVKTTPGYNHLLVTDGEVNDVSDYNLVVVGGTCINKVAARLLGVDEGTCGDEWKAETGVGAGQYLIESFNSPYKDGKVALLIAGYDAADTKAGVAMFVEESNKITDTAPGKKYFFTGGILSNISDK